jgi:LysM repeat protein
MSKKPKLLATLLASEKRRHHVTAFVNQEADWNQHEPTSGFARMFIAMLILHVLIIGGIILSDSSSVAKAPAHAPAAQALMTKSKNEIASVPSRAPVVPAPATSGGEEFEKYEVRSGDSLPMIVARFGVDLEELIELNHLDTNGGFAAGTVLQIPNHKVAAPLQISAARPLPPMAVMPPSSSPTSDAASSLTDVTASSSAPVSDAHSTLVSLSTKSDSVPLLAPLPDVPAAAASTTVAEKLTPDSPPPASSKPVVSKSDSVATHVEREKPAQKKPVVASAPPRPVPTPSEMAKRPVTKADAPPKAAVAKTATKAKPATAAGGTHTLAKGETLYGLSARYGVSVASLIKANNIKDPGKMRDGLKLVIPAK